MGKPNAVSSTNAASTSASSEPADPVAAALHAVDVAEAEYKTVSYRRNVLEFKAKQQNDLQAKAALPQAQRDVEAAQEKLKEAQSTLARVSGAEDPHARKTAVPLNSRAPKKVEERGT